MPTALRRYGARIPADFRRNFFWDLVAAVLIGVFVAITSSFVPVVARRLGASAFLMALLTAAPYAGSLFAVLAAYYLQGKPKMPFMLWAWNVSRGLFFLLLFVTTPLPFVLIVMAYWVIANLPVPGYAEVMRQVYPDAYRGRAMSYVRVGMTACVTVLTPVAGQLLDLVGYQFLFPLAGAFGILSSLAFGRIRVDEIPSQERRPLAAIWQILGQDRRFRDYSLAFFVYGFGNLLIVPLIPIFLVDELHLSYGQVGVLGMVNAVFWMMFYVVWGRTVDRQGPCWTLKANFFLTVFVSLGFFLAQDMRLVALAYIFLGITTAGIDLGWMNAIMRLASKDRVGDYAALHTGLVGVRGLIAPFLGTWLMAIPWMGLRGVFLLSAALILVGWLLIRRIPTP